MSHFLETDLREQQNYEKRIQTSVDNKVNDLRHEIKFEKHLSFFPLLEKYFFKIPKNSIVSAYFC